jgi:hypothetical protein
MKAHKVLVLTTLFLFSVAQRLPAPVNEIEETPAPTVKHPVEHKSRTSAKQRSQDETSSGQKSSVDSQDVTVVLTENTIASLAHLRAYVQTVGSVPFGMQTDVKPDEILERLRQVLSTRFRNVSIPDRAGDQRTKGPTMIFDLHAKVGMVSFQTNSVAISATFKNASGQVTDTLTASGSSRVPYPNWRTHFPEAVATAFKEFSQKFAAVRR